MNGKSLKSFLMKTPFFGGLSDEALERISQMLKVRSYPEGSTIFMEGDTGASMYIIQSGEVLVVRNGCSGHRVRLARLREGDFFGETTLIEMQPRPVTAHAETDLVLLELANMDLYRLYREDVKAYVMVVQNINRELCRRLRWADCRLTELASAAGDEVTQISRRSNG
ncbi:MAG: cyclic nucleotide-binding domain-containing protein [Myxococcales bacterium]|jgi:CRP/FNR family cyclic AMP-dependent transcriptional regulator